MPQRLCIQPHLSIEELEKRYRQAKSVTERSHYQILWLLAQGKPSQEVAAVTGYSRNWIYELVRSYNQMGAEAVGDLRRDNRGALPKLDDKQQANLLQAIRGVAPDGGLLNGRKVADYLTEVLGTPVSRQQGCHLLLLPPYSPELQPAERRCPLVNEPLVNQAFASIDEVEEVVYQRCQRLLQQQALIRGLTSYHWLPFATVA